MYAESSNHVAKKNHDDDHYDNVMIWWPFVHSFYFCIYNEYNDNSSNLKNY